MLTRKETLQSIKNNPRTTALIIGAGINGIGTFRDLALQGVDCLIVERADFCSGASMASSHMLHGGIRYLENGEFRLVREALHERNNLLRNAPHLTRPMPTAIPIFKWLSGILNAPLKFVGLMNKPAERGAVIIKMGMMMYDFFVRGDNQMPKHR
ncbi:MAG: FAD-dependent oxidoreductase, partial [Anaerolineales bacterium]